MVRKLKKSISAKIFGSILLILILTCTLLFSFIHLSLPKTYERQIVTQFTKEFYNLIEELTKVEEKGLSEKVQIFAMEHRANIQMLDDTGEVLYKINLDEGNGDKKRGQDIIEASFTNDNRTYTILAQVPMRGVSDLNYTLASILPVTIVSIVVISFIGAFLYSKIISKPIKNLSGAAQKMAKLDFTGTCDVRGEDEISVLAESLNIMAFNLETAMNDLKNEISKQKRQDKQRSELFTALSHELKTPITILRGEIGGMIDMVGSYKDRDKYLQHTLEVTENMEKIVRDMLSISRMESNKIQLNFKDVSIMKIIKRYLKKYEWIIKKKEFEMIEEYNQEFVVCADRMQIETAISNIIGNAVYHSPEGAKIRIKTFQRGNKHILSVLNTGIFIVDDDLERIFEPFYRVDKSRYTQGSGLGLYAVKTILNAHGLNYKIRNTSTGVEFEVEFLK